MKFLGVISAVSLAVSLLAPLSAFADASSTSISVNSAPSTPSITVPSSLVAGTSYQIAAVSTDPQGDQISYGFDWNGDGQVDEWTPFAPSGTSQSISHTWQTAGNSTFTVVAKDQWNAVSAAATGSVTVQSQTQTSTSTTTTTGGTSSTTSTSTSSTTGSTATSTSSTATSTSSSTSTTSTSTSSTSTTTTSSSGTSGGGSGVSGSNVTPSVNSAPSAPTVTGPTSVIVGSPVQYSMTSTDLQGDQIAYGIDWNGDGQVDEWTSFSPSGSTVTIAHTWYGAGTASVTFVAKDIWNAVSDPTVLVVAASEPNNGGSNGGGTGGGSTTTPSGGGTGTSTGSVNSAPSTPSITVPSSLVAGTSYQIAAVSTDPQGDQISYGFDWNGDGQVDEWTPFAPSGTSQSISHTWQTAGNSTFTVVAKDQWNAVSDPVTENVTVASSGTSGGGGSNGGGSNTGGGTTTPSGGNGTTTPSGGNGTTTPSGGGTTTPSGGGTSTSGHRSGGGGGYTGPCIGYGCPVATAGAPTGGTSSGGISLPGNTQIILPSGGYSSGGPTGPEQVCPSVNFITTFLRAGADNDPTEVKKLQYFLNTYENAGLTVSGQFDAATEAAVKAFQAKYSQEILAPWGVSTPTGIVYITTTREINTIYCGDHPTYAGNQDLKDMLGNVPNVPATSNPGQFQNVIGQNTSTSTGFISNIAGVFGAMTSRVTDALNKIPIYQLIIILLILLGTGFVIQGTFKKDMASSGGYVALMRGAALLAVGSVLNVLNSLSFMIDPAWISDHLHMTLPWILGLDLLNVVCIVAIALSALVSLHSRSGKAAAGK